MILDRNLQKFTLLVLTSSLNCSSYRLLPTWLLHLMFNKQYKVYMPKRPWSPQTYLSPSFPLSLSLLSFTQLFKPKIYWPFSLFSPSPRSRPVTAVSWIFIFFPVFTSAALVEDVIVPHPDSSFCHGCLRIHAPCSTQVTCIDEIMSLPWFSL